MRPRRSWRWRSWCAYTHTHTSQGRLSLCTELCVHSYRPFCSCCTPPQPLGFALEGHPLPAYNGAYRKVSEHKGWPVLRNGAGMFCYRYEPADQWELSDKHAPDSGTSVSNIVSAEGPLPSGAQTWRCWVDGEWVDRSLSVTVLVRPFPSLMLSASACISSVSLSHTVLSLNNAKQFNTHTTPAPISALAIRLLLLPLPPPLA
jgi:hypothetical protein